MVLRKNTVFSHSNLQVRQVFTFLMKLSYDETILEVNFGEETKESQLSRNTVASMFDLFRDICSFAVEQQSQNKIGGPGKTVEIDEAKFGKRKYNRGRFVGAGGICCQTNEIFLETRQLCYQLF